MKKHKQISKYPYTISKQKSLSLSRFIFEFLVFLVCRGYQYQLNKHVKNKIKRKGSTENQKLFLFVLSLFPTEPSLVVSL